MEYDMNKAENKHILENLVAYNAEIEGIDHNDYPDFVDAYIISAEHKDGQEFTDQEIDYFNEYHSDQVYEMVINQLF